MSDYRIKVNIRNNRLLEALEKKGYINNGNPSVLKFCKSHGLDYNRTNLLFSGKVSPINQLNQLTSTAKRVLDYLDLTIEQAFTEKQLKGFAKNTYVIKVKESELTQLVNNSKSLEIKMMESETNKIVNNCMDVSLKLGERYQKVWDGVNGGKTLNSIGEELGITRQRVDQMYNKIQEQIKKQIINKKRKLLNAGIKEVYPKVDI